LAQESWNIKDPFGYEYNVGMYHGDRTGHLLIYVNGEPVIIDFGVEDSKSYSLVVGTVLYDLILKKVGLNFDYDFKRNEAYIEELQEKRKEEEEGEKVILLVAICIILAVIYIIRNIL